VVEVGSEVKGWKVGDLVSGRNPEKTPPGINSLWGGQAAYQVYPTSGGTVPILLPAGASPLDYIAVEPAAISWRGVEMTAAVAGESAVVVGQGLIGALGAAWLKERGCRVITIDRSPTRLKRAEQWADTTLQVGEGDIAARVAALLPHGPDIVVEASASVPGLKTAYSLVRQERPAFGKTSSWPRLLLQATYTDEVTLHPSNWFNGEGVLVLTPGDRSVANRQHVVDSIARGSFSCAPFVDKVVPFSEAPTAYLQLRDQPDAVFSLIYDWSSVG
jgi:threonine dehydrogenase-like Zn-dependent dehydrogenase